MMIAHLVLLKLPETLSPAERDDVERSVGSLAGIARVRDMSWGRDFSGRGRGYTYAAVMHFEDGDALQAYQVAEQHRDAVATFERLGVERLVIDYEMETSGIFG